MQPNTEAVSLVDPETIELYMRFLFQFEGQWLPGYCGLRGISEPIKGAAVNDFHEINEDLPDKVIDKVKEWTANGVASFVIPAVLNSKSGKEDAISRFTTVLVDKAIPTKSARCWPSVVVSRIWWCSLAGLPMSSGARCTAIGGSIARLTMSS